MRILGRFSDLASDKPDDIRLNECNSTALDSKALKKFSYEFAGLLAKACNMRPLPKDRWTGNATPA